MTLAFPCILSRPNSTYLDCNTNVDLLPGHLCNNSIGLHILSPHLDLYIICIAQNWAWGWPVGGGTSPQVPHTLIMGNYHCHIALLKFLTSLC